jgi:predicted nucleic acid-binding protein
MYLLDTNVISELRKGVRADAGVRAFFASCDSSVLYLPVQVIGELRAGAVRIRRRGDSLQADRLDGWIDALTREYAQQVLGFDLECAQFWGWLMGLRPDSPVDKQIAAIAYSYGLTVLTRNQQHFDYPSLQTLNPFQG